MFVCSCPETNYRKFFAVLSRFRGYDVFVFSSAGGGGEEYRILVLYITTPITPANDCFGIFKGTLSQSVLLDVQQSHTCDSY